MEIKNQILGIGSSPRKGGNTDLLLKAVLSGAATRGVDTEELQLRNYHYLPCTGCEKCKKSIECTGSNDGMQLIYPKLLAARGLVLASPTHNFNVTAWMKAFIDRTYCFFQFDNKRPRGYKSCTAGQGRKMVLIAIGEQSRYEEAIGLTLDAMSIPFEYLGYDLVGTLPVTGIFDRGAVSNNLEVMERAWELGATLAEAITES